MATLDEKYLDGPNVGYCSDSDEEEQPDAGSSDMPMPSNASVGRAGPKGVIDDYNAQKEVSRMARIQAESNVSPHMT